MQSALEERLKKDPVWMQKPFFAYLFRHSSAIILCAFLFILYGLFLSHPIDLVPADLGRHIKNGEMILQNSPILSQNVYSYTHPNFQWVNHHWASGVLSYFVWTFFGFTGLHLSFILLSFAALAIFLLAGRVYANWGIVGFVALATLPLLAERTEVRPEVISYLFAGLFFFLLSRFREQPQARMSILGLWFLPVIEMFWVNLHVYFLLGPLLVGAFLLESLLIRRAVFFRLAGIFVLTVGAMLLNPFGYRAFTAAVTIFGNYGYRLAENQPVWFMEKLIADPNFFIFKVVFSVCVLLFIFVAVRNWRGIRLAHVFVIAGISIMAWLAIRNLALFGLFAIPFISAHIRTLLPNQQEARENWLIQLAMYGTAFALLLSLLFGLPKYFPYWRSFGFGLETGNSAPVEFIREHHIVGPYFNNYDIGGYLIFHLFPDEKVFVDNRPEAYPVAFFQDVYIPMQEEDAVWEEKLEEYRFNAIVFSYRDATPWGQHFLIQRLQDPEWAPVFVNERVLIFVRRIEAHKALIEKFLLPPETFRISA